jgi:hypothetical protein
MKPFQEISRTNLFGVCFCLHLQKVDLMNDPVGPEDYALRVRAPLTNSIVTRLIVGKDVFA